jgi:hypothetical protein
MWRCARLLYLNMINLQLPDLPASCTTRQTCGSAYIRSEHSSSIAPVTLRFSKIMPAKKSKSTSAKATTSTDAPSLWEIARHEDQFRYDLTPPSYSKLYCFAIIPRASDRKFQASIKKEVVVSLWDLTKKCFHEVKIPRAYLIHIWWIQMQAKFWLDTAAGPEGRRMANYLTLLIDEFAKEVLEKNATDGWRSKVLHGILCRSFYHISEGDVNSDFKVVLLSTRKRKSNKHLQIGDIEQKDFNNIYHQHDVVSDRCRQGANHSMTGWSRLLTYI